MTIGQKIGYWLSEWIIGWLIFYGLVIMTFFMFDEKATALFASFITFVVMFGPVVIVKTLAIRRSNRRVKESTPATAHEQWNNP